MPKGNTMKEGWGIAFQKKYSNNLKTSENLLYSTDGSNNIFVIDSDNWTQKSTISIKNKFNQQVPRLNELEILQKNIDTNMSDEEIESQKKRQKYIFAN